MTQLYPHQKNILEKNPPKKILAWATSLGKTLALMELSKLNISARRDTVIVCPKSLKKRWQRDMPSAYVFTKEEFRRDWKKIPRGQALIVDEIHHFSGNSQMTKAILGYIQMHQPTFIWGASATPYRSTPWNVYYLAKVMGLHWKFHEFRTEFFHVQYMGHRMIWVPNKDERSRVRLMKALSQFCDVVSAEDANLAQEDVFEEELFTLTPEQKQRIKRLQLEETIPPVKYGKEHQIAQGFMRGDEFTPTQFFKNEKMPRILELAQENKSMLIFSRYTDQIEMMTKALRDAGHKVFVFTGATKNRQEMIEEVQAADQCILIAQTALGEGWEAPRFDFIVFASLPWSFVDYTQCIGRASRANVPKRRVYLTLTVEGSIDEKVQQSLNNKEDFHLELYNPTK